MCIALFPVGFIERSDILAIDRTSRSLLIGPRFEVEWSLWLESIIFFLIRNVNVQFWTGTSTYILYPIWHSILSRAARLLLEYFTVDPIYRLSTLSRSIVLMSITVNLFIVTFVLHLPVAAFSVIVKIYSYLSCLIHKSYSFSPYSCSFRGNHF